MTLDNALVLGNLYEYLTLLIQCEKIGKLVSLLTT